MLIILALFADRGDLQSWIITLFSVGNLLLIGLFSLSPYLRNDQSEPPEPPLEAAEPDAELWERLSEYMLRQRPYLDPNLTLAQLARKLRVPAKALSIAINRATGENVSRFVNKARITEAQTLLIQGKTVTDAMLSSGFNTKSNFNREFLRVAGSSPSDWLGGAKAKGSGR